jgi:hypothetical protein
MQLLANLSNTRIAPLSVQFVIRNTSCWATVAHFLSNFHAIVFTETEFKS